MHRTRTFIRSRGPVIVNRFLLETTWNRVANAAIRRLPTAREVIETRTLKTTFLFPLICSNVDWGQDLVYLKEWLDEHPGEGPLFLAYYGYFKPVLKATRAVTWVLPFRIFENSFTMP